MVRRLGLLSGIAASTVFVAAVLAVLLGSGAHGHILSLLLWLEGQGNLAWVLFVLVIALVVVFLLPGALFTTGAGFVFGVVEGTSAVVAGTTIGAGLAFLIARYLLRGTTTRYLHNHPKLRGVDEELKVSGWKAVLFVRLVPFFPSKLANYFFGLTQVPLRAFLAGTFIGVIPLSLHNVYLGAIAADIATVGSFGARTPMGWAIYILGFVGTVAAVVYLARLARRVLARYEQIEAP